MQGQDLKLLQGRVLMGTTGMRTDGAGEMNVSLCSSLQRIQQIFLIG